MQNKIKRIIGLVIICCTILFFSGDVFAVSVKPTVTEVRIKPGEKEKRVYTVTNNSKRKMSVRIAPIDWVQRLFGTRSSHPVSSWVIFDETEFDLEIGESKDINYTVTVPKDLTGELVAQVFFEDVNPGSNIKSKLGVILYAIAKGTEKIDAEIKNMNLSLAKDGDKQGLQATALIQNNGNVHVRPFGSVDILKGKDVLYTLEIPFRKGIYAGKQDQMASDILFKELPAGDYTLKGKLEISYSYGFITYKYFEKKLKWDGEKEVVEKK